MNTILILYPSAFQCFEKFERKVTNILSNLENFLIITKNDHNRFIKMVKEKHFHKNQIQELNDLQDEKITHAIIFDDGEEFSSETKHLLSHKTPTRLIKIKITRVINIKDKTEYSNKKSTSSYEYIGRNSEWGNPYSILEGDDREEVIRKYEYDFERGYINQKDKIYNLAGKRLGCFCKPAKCHGDILAAYLNRWDDGK